MNAAAPADARPVARALGAATLGLALGALLLGRMQQARRLPAPVAPHLPAPLSPHVPPHLSHSTRNLAAASAPANGAAAQQAHRLYQAAALLAASVLSDSAMEHYRGDFENPGMFAPLASAAVVLACALGGARRGASAGSGMRTHADDAGPRVRAADARRQRHADQGRLPVPDAAGRRRQHADGGPMAVRAADARQRLHADHDGLAVRSADVRRQRHADRGWLPLRDAAGRMQLHAEQDSAPVQDAGAGLPPQAPRQPSALPYLTACAVGTAGLGFHAYNVLRRPGGLSWANLFYAAPLGAPAALALAGALGLAARPVAAGAATLAGLPTGRALCGLAAFGLAGTSAEAGLLHFRGAFQHPAMWLPVSVPPATALLLAGAALPGRRGPRPLTQALLKACTWLGALGMAFHARGIARQMGGWRNWSQNVFAGPPLPAPPSFSALALAGRAALALRAAQEATPGARQGTRQGGAA